MKKIIRNIMFILVFFGILIISNNVFAATAELTVSDTDKVINVGDTVTVTIKVNSAQWDLSVNASGLTYVSGTQRFTELDNAEKNLSKSTNVKYKASKAGEFNIVLSGDITDISGENKDVSQTIKLTVKEKVTNSGGDTGNQNANSGSNNGTTNNNSSGNNSTTNNNSGSTTSKPVAKSTNAYLSTLGVRISQADANELGVGTNEYDFKGFSKSSLSYKVTVPYEVESLKVSYKAAHSGATVKVTGNTGFDVGSSNKITIKVTAEDEKTTKTYTIKVTRLAEEEEKPGNIIEDNKIEELFLTSLNIKGVELSPKFSKDVYAYTATLSNNLGEVEVNAVANKENATIEVSGNTNLVVGENTINIIVKEAEGTSQAVYQITLTKEATAVVTTGEENNFMSSLIGNLKNYIVIAILVVVLMIATVIILIILLRKENKRIKEQKTEEEYNVYNNDENEFEDNKVEEIVKEQEIEEITNETETKNEGKRTRRKEKGRHSK